MSPASGRKRRPSKSSLSSSKRLKASCPPKSGLATVVYQQKGQVPSMAEAVPGATFPLFSKLPSELQMKIFEEALPSSIGTIYITASLFISSHCFNVLKRDIYAMCHFHLPQEDASPDKMHIRLALSATSVMSRAVFLAAFPLVLDVRNNDCHGGKLHFNSLTTIAILDFETLFLDLTFGKKRISAVIMTILSQIGTLGVFRGSLVGMEYLEYARGMLQFIAKFFPNITSLRYMCFGEFPASLANRLRYIRPTQEAIAHFNTQTSTGFIMPELEVEGLPEP